MQPSAALGIDPGTSGALALLSTAGHEEIWDVPTITTGKRLRLFLPACLEILRGVKTQYPTVHVFLEDVHAMPGNGAVSSFAFGRGLGQWEGLLAALEIPHTLVLPQTWKKKMMAGLPPDKGASRLRAGQLFPNCASLLQRVKDHNRADALLIARYGLDLHPSS